MANSYKALPKWHISWDACLSPQGLITEDCRPLAMVLFILLRLDTSSGTETLRMLCNPAGSCPWEILGGSLEAQRQPRSAQQAPQNFSFWPFPGIRQLQHRDAGHPRETVPADEALVKCPSKAQKKSRQDLPLLLVHPSPQLLLFLPAGKIAGCESWGPGTAPPHTSVSSWTGLSPQHGGCRPVFWQTGAVALTPRTRGLALGGAGSLYGPCGDRAWGGAVTCF